MSLRIDNYTINNKGNDYVVGDIHGEYLNLMNLLKKIHFNFKKDRLFSVGDLVNRGFNSKELLKWIDYSWFIPVMGNHESMIINNFYGLLSNHILLQIDAQWWLELKTEDQQKVVHYFNSLPIGIKVETLNGDVGIVHAKCPEDTWLKFAQGINNSGDSFDKAKVLAGKAMWTIYKDCKFKKIEDLLGLVVGHNTVKHYCKEFNVHMIDTGSGYSDGKLTILDLKTMTPVVI